MQVEQTELQQFLASISDLKTEFKASEVRLEAKIDTFNEKFDNYQKSTQQIVIMRKTSINAGSQKDGCHKDSR